jgi:hypothetical protein
MSGRASELVVRFGALCLLCCAPGAHALSVTPDFAFTLSVDPPRPQVGDTVRLTFTVAMRSGRGGLPAYRLSVDSAVLEGNEAAEPHNTYFPDTVTFERRALAAGVAQVQLDVNYEAGVEHEGSCCVWFFTIAQSPVFELTVFAADENQTVSESCDGDCDGDGRVRVDELTRAIGIALARLSSNSCPSLPPVVTVDTLVRAVQAALHGCSATPTPTPTPTTTPIRPVVPTATPTQSVTVSESGIDLYPLRLVPARCLAAECLTVPFDSGSVCVANRGDEDAGSFLVSVNGETQVLLDGVPSGVVRCFDLPDLDSGTVIVDADDRITESDEDNNEQSFPAPGPTACDVIVPPCTPTPTVENVQSCAECCNHCTTEACFAACFGVQGCQLITEWEGTVTDAATSEPIAGAAVTVNGTTASTDAEGLYSTTSVKDEVCNGLDYLYEIAVRAPGYRDFIGRMYQSLVPGTRVQNVELERDPK